MKLRSLSLSNILSLAIPLWIASVSFPLLSLRYIYLIEGEAINDEVSRIYTIASLMMLSISAFLLVAIFGSRSMRRPSASFIMLNFFALLCVLFSCIHMNASSLLFSFMLIAVIYSVRIITFECDFKIVNTICALVLFLFIVLSLIMYYPPMGRYLGGIHPNIYGACLVAAVYFALFIELKYIRYAIFITGFVCSLIISSRYAMLSIFFIVLFNYIADQRLDRAVARILIVVVAFLLLSMFLMVSGDNFISDALELSNPQRGFGSGGSGRLDLYENFWSQFADGVVIGYGFRARDMYMGAHNGILNTILENGIFSSLILFSAIAVRAFELVKIIVADGSRSYAKYYLFGLGACLFSALFQPQLINFGDPLGVVFLLVLAAHPRPLAVSQASRAGRQRVPRMSAQTSMAVRQPPAG